MNAISTLGWFLIITMGFFIGVAIYVENTRETCGCTSLNIPIVILLIGLVLIIYDYIPDDPKLNEEKP